jgi:hypothetical protein
MLDQGLYGASVARYKKSTSLSSLSLADLQALIDAKHSELTTRREQIAAEIASIDAQIGAGEGGRAPTRRGPGRPKSRRGPGRPPKVMAKAKRGRPAKAAKARMSGKRRGRPAGPKGKSPLHDAIRVSLKGAEAPMKAVDIAKEVLDGGYKTESKVFHLIIGQRLAEMADVVKPARGLYALRD